MKLRIYLTVLSLFFFLSCQEQEGGEGASTQSKSAQSKPAEQVGGAEQKTVDTSSKGEASAVKEEKKTSVYTPYLEGKLLSLQKGELAPYNGFQEPKKYYLFYKTASWCPPCQRFTPLLVNFYNDHKAIYGNDFEVILLSSDRTLDAMKKYAVSKKMIWPHLSLEHLPAFHATFSFPGTGIPNTILTNTAGEILSTSYGPNGEYLGPDIPVKKLQSLLANQ